MLTLMEPEAEGFPTPEDKFHQSLAAQVLKLLAVVAQAGPSGLDNKRTFISRFYGHLYPADIATYFTEQFDRFLDQQLDLGAVCFFLNKRLSYQEKIFCLLVVHEFIVSGDPDVVEIRLAKGMAKMLEIKPVDARFVESQFGLADPPTPDMGEASILALNVTGDPDTADVYLPFPGLDVVLYKIQNLYCLTKKSREHDVVVDGYPLFQNISTRISHNYLIRINDYDLRHHDLKAYFENKVSPLKAEIYVVQEDLEPVFSRLPADKSVLRLDFSGARIRLKLLDAFALVNVEDSLVTDHVYVNLDDDIFVNGYRLNVRELFYFLNARRELSLSAARSEYLVTNDINGDLFISDELSESWVARLIIDSRRLRYLFDPGDCPYQVYRNGHAMKGVFDISHDDTVFLNGSYLTLDLERGVIRKARFSFNKVVAVGLKYVFDDGNVGLDEVSFDVEYGELMAIMGPSGSGKSTLLRVMSGFSGPDEGHLGVDDYDLHRDYAMIKNHLGYVPQDDMLMGNLTVYENLYYYAKLRFPDRSEEELNAKIEVVLNDIGLTGRKHLRVGSVTDKVLSGGERKRLNIGLELLSDAEIYLLDEPTSGLSSKDSEKIVELLGNITLRGKIVVCVIHQPSSRIYKHFDKVVLLDHGGKLAYYGTAYRALEYFKCHMEKQACVRGAAVECPSCKRVEPNILLDSLEESLRDIDGSVIGKRKYSPEYWQEQYRTGAVDSWLTSINLPKSDILPPEPKMGVYERFVQFKTLLSRNYRSKVRDRANLVITFLEAPFLGAGVGFILRYNPRGEYSLYTNDLYSIFLFVAVIVTMFLSMTNSVDEIIADRTLFMRERMLNMTNRTYLAAKMLTLMPFALVQNILFVIFGFLFMEVRELVTLHVVYLTALSYAGLSAGLFISSIPGLSSRAAQNIVPLILVPQIILGGALIEYEKMNKSLTIVENSPIPEICQFMPSRWAYEGLVVMQESYNSYHDRHDVLSDQVRELKFAYADEADPAKKRKLKEQRDAAVDELEAFRESHKYRYGNKTVHDAIMLGEKRYEELIMENIGSDPERAEDMVEGAVMDWNMAYPMFVRNKVIPFLGVKANTAVYNILVLLAIAAILNMCTLGLLQFREELVRTTGKMARKMAKRRKRGGKE